MTHATNTNAFYAPYDPLRLQRIAHYLANTAVTNPASPYSHERIGGWLSSLRITLSWLQDAIMTAGVNTSASDTDEARSRLRNAFQEATTARMRLAAPLPTDRVNSGTYYTPDAKKRRKSLSAQLVGYIPKIKNMNGCASFMYDLSMLDMRARDRLVQVPALYDAVSAYNTRRNIGRREYLSTSPYVQGYEELARALCVYVSEDNPSKVAYYPTVRSVIEDRPVRTTLAKWLTKYRGHAKVSAALTDAEIKRRHEQYVARHAGLDTDSVEFAKTPEMWEWVYANGPDSCMCGESAVRIYSREGNGLRLAFWRDPSDENVVIARAIVREDTKKFVRVYPNPDKRDDDRLLHNKFRSVLEAIGYTHGNLNGVKLAYEETQYGEIVCPYIDYGNGGSQSVDIGYDVMGKYLVVTPNGEFSATETNGLLDNNSHTCDVCGERCSEDDTTYVESHGSVCPSCIEREFVSVHSSRQYWDDYEWVHTNNDYITAVDGERFIDSDVAIDLDYNMCEYSNEWHPLDDLVYCDAGSYEDRYVLHEYVVTTIDDQHVHEDDVTQTEDGWVLDDDVQECYITEALRHEQFMIGIDLPGKVVYIDGDTTSAALVDTFDVLVDGDSYTLTLKGDGQTITDDLMQQMYDHGVTNVTEGDVASFDNIIS